jgi:ssRNA-specific RNase YbeY (16S rRNA maturation enzyme)
MGPLRTAEGETISARRVVSTVDSNKSVLISVVSTDMRYSEWDQELSSRLSLVGVVHFGIRPFRAESRTHPTNVFTFPAARLESSGSNVIGELVLDVPFFLHTTSQDKKTTHSRDSHFDPASYPPRPSASHL